MEWFSGGGCQNVCNLAGWWCVFPGRVFGRGQNAHILAQAAGEPAKRQREPRKTATGPFVVHEYRFSYWGMSWKIQALLAPSEETAEYGVLFRQCDLLDFSAGCQNVCNLVGWWCVFPGRVSGSAQDAHILAQAAGERRNSRGIVVVWRQNTTGTPPQTG